MPSMIWSFIRTDSYAFVIKSFLIKKKIIGVNLILGVLETQKALKSE